MLLEESVQHDQLMSRWRRGHLELSAFDPVERGVRRPGLTYGVSHSDESFTAAHDTEEDPQHILEPVSVRVAVLLLVGLLVTILALYPPEAGAAVVGAATAVALLAEVTARK
ncbi:hypothetical protein [Streptomyces sp. NPDC058953]|uniref:hypothetical protein n=1 Tax=unclassified Streptomyces TaxID=2593676 RepID=UPI0036A94AF7